MITSSEPRSEWSWATDRLTSSHVAHGRVAPGSNDMQRGRIVLVQLNFVFNLSFAGSS